MEAALIRSAKEQQGVLDLQERCGFCNVTPGQASIGDLHTRFASASGFAISLAGDPMVGQVSTPVKGRSRASTRRMHMDGFEALDFTDDGRHAIGTGTAERLLPRLAGSDILSAGAAA